MIRKQEKRSVKIWEVAHFFPSARLILHSLELSCNLREIYLLSHLLQMVTPPEAA